MKNVCIFIADGFEETEALTTVDLLRRGGINVTMVSIGETEEVIGAHEIKVIADSLFNFSEVMNADALVLPGGTRGVENMNMHIGVHESIKKFNEAGKLICAICAAPTILGEMNLLYGKNACCYTGLEYRLTGAIVDANGPCVTDGNIVTSKGVGTAIWFALEIISILTDEETMYKVKKEILF